MIRQSAFKGLRKDKPAKKVRAEHPVPPNQAELATPSKVTKGKAPSAKIGANVVMGVTLSHPDKALWAAEKGEQPVTKRDLAMYLKKVGPWMIEHLKGRPCSIIRAPDGITDQTFVQRHAMPGVSNPVKRSPLRGLPKLRAAHLSTPPPAGDRVLSLPPASQTSRSRAHCRHRALRPSCPHP
jgi:bifunctional non-homologous end joining protein LigD